MIKRAVVCCFFVVWYGAYSVAAAPTKAERDYQALMKQYRQWSKSQPRGKRTSPTKPIKMSPQAKALLRGLATYSNTYRRSPRRYDAAYKLAKLLYDHNRFGQALVIFDRVIRKQPRRKIAVYAAQLTLDMYNIQKRWKVLRKAAEGYLATRGLGGTSFKRQMRQLAAQSYLKVCQGQSSIAAAQCYEKAGLQYRKEARLAAAAHYNAARIYQKAKQPGKCIGLLKKIGKTSHRGLYQKAQQQLRRGCR